MFDLGIHLVDLFQGQAFGFEDAEVDEEDTAETASSPDEENLCFEPCCIRAFVHEIRGGISDRPIEEPVACNGAGNGLCAESE
jgi:hypothetical protein